MGTTALIPKRGSQGSIASYQTDSSGNVTGLLAPSGTNAPLSRQSSIASLKLLPSPGSQALAGDITSGKVINSQLPAFAPFFGVKLIYQNYDTANTMDIDGVKVAPSVATAGAGSSANNSALTFSGFVTFAGSQSVSIPVAVTGVGGQVIPTEIVSDFIQITSLARTDTVGAPPLLRVATHFAPSANQTVHPSYNGTNYTNLNTLAANPKFNHGNNSFTGTLAALITSAQPTYDIYGGVQNPIGAIFYYSSGVQEIAAFGDSLIQGVGSSTSYAGWPEYLTWGSYSNSLNFVCANYGTSAQKTVDTLAVAKAVLSKYSPKYAVMKAWSPNDGNTQAIFDASWGYTLEFINYCLNLDIIPIVLTSGPATGYSWTLTKAQNVRVMALPASVIKVDVAAIINNSASDGTILPAYDSDGTHYNDAGYAAIADEVKTSIAY
ncbi:MAG TPA: SGNH/GDSL hydrolase family protein [Methylotenera sp.]|nr:SGNH/GDSL hydrolase family protein [Methylotenera sp.]